MNWAFWPFKSSFLQQELFLWLQIYIRVPSVVNFEETEVILEFLLIKYKPVHDRSSVEKHDSIDPEIEKSTNFEVEARKLFKHIEQELIQESSFTGKRLTMEHIRHSRYKSYPKWKTGTTYQKPDTPLILIRQ